MPKIEISRSTTRLPRSSGFGSIGPVDFSTGAGQGLKALGQAVGAFGQEKLEEARLAEDSSFVADQTVKAQKRAYEIREELKSQYSGDYAGYTEAVTRQTAKEFDQVLASAPSARARKTLQSTFVGMRTNQFAQARNFQQQAFVQDKTNKVEESANLLGLQIQQGELDYDQATALFKEHDASMDTFLGPKASKALSESSKLNLIESQTKALASAEGADIEDVEAFLSRQDVSKSLDTGQRETLLARAQYIMDKEEDKRQDLFNEVKEDTQNQIRNFTMLGNHDQAMTLLDKSIEDGVIEAGSTEHVAMFDFVSKGVKKYQEVRAAKQRVNAAISGESIINVDNDADLKAYQTYWDNEFPDGFMNANPETQQKMMNVINSAQALPPKLQQELELTINTGAPQQRAVASQTLVDLANQQNGQLVRNVSDDALLKARRFEALTQSYGGNSEEAARVIDAAQARSRDPSTEVAVQEMNSFISSKAGRKLIAEEFDLKKDEIPPELKSFLQTTAGTAFALSHSYTSKESELQFQIENAKRAWKTVDIFGNKKLVRNGPGSEEKEMSFGGERSNFQSKQIEDQLDRILDQSFVGEEDLIRDQKIQSVKDSVSLIPVQENGRKRYMISYRHNGTLQTLQANGQPVTVDVDRSRETGVILNNQKAIMREQAAEVENEIRAVADRLFGEDAKRAMVWGSEVAPMGKFNIIQEESLGPDAQKLRELMERAKKAQNTFENNRGTVKGLIGGDRPGPDQLFRFGSTEESRLKTTQETTKKAREVYANEIKAIMDELNALEPDDIKGSEGQDRLEGDNMSFLQRTPEAPQVDLSDVNTIGRLTRMAEIGGNENLQNKIHIPRTVGGVVGNSGVTIGVGYDLGQRSEGEIRSDLRSAGVPEDVIQDLTKFAGKKGAEAAKAMETSPVNGVSVLTDSQADKLFALKYKPKLEEADSIISSISGIDDNPVGKSMLRQSLSSALYQINLPKVFPDATAQLKRGNWEAATKAMVYASRTDKSKGPSKWAMQTPERILPIIEAMEEISGKELKSILMLAEGVDTNRIS